MVGVVGLGVLAALWLTPIHARHGLACGSLVGSIGTFTNHSVHGPCQDARTTRFWIGLAAAVVFAPGAWVVFLTTGGWGWFRAQLRQR